MFNLEELFSDFFKDPHISLAELSNYSHVHIDRMIALNPETVFAGRITATQVALAALEERTTDTGVKAAIQKGKTQNKKNFRETLPSHMAKVQGKVIGQYGKDAAEVLEIFPKGLSVFRLCRDVELNNELEVTYEGLLAHVGDLGTGPKDTVGALLSLWISTFNLQSGAKTATKTTAKDLTDLRAALQLELHKNALFVALTFPMDEAKGMFYLPQELLRNATAPVGLPGAAVMQMVEVAGGTRAVTLRMQSLGADTMKLERRGEFELEASVVQAAIPVVNGVCVFTDTAPADGLWNYKATPANEGGEGEASAELGVQVD